MIERLRLQNFKGHRDTTVELGRLTVLVGPNGSGKTSVLQGLRLLSQLVDDHAFDIFVDEREPAALLRSGSAGPLVVEATGTQASLPWEIAAELIFETDAKGTRLRTTQLGWDTGRTKQQLGGMAQFRGRFHGTPDPLWDWLSAATIFRLDAREIAAPGYSEDGIPRVEPNGRNAASALAALKLAEDPAFSAVEERLRKLVPAVERIRFRLAQTLTEQISRPTKQQRLVEEQTVTGQQFVFDYRGAREVSALGASEGTLVLLALLTALHTSAKSGLVLIDDIEHSLHPMAQVQLMKQLKELLTQLPDLQIVATTHSPYILDGVDPSDVRVFYPRGDGSIVTKRLSDHPDAQRAKGMLTSGELWSAESEAWVLGEDAAQ